MSDESCNEEISVERIVRFCKLIMWSCILLNTLKFSEIPLFAYSCTFVYLLIDLIITSALREKPYVKIVLKSTSPNTSTSALESWGIMMKRMWNGCLFNRTRKRDSDYLTEIKPAYFNVVFVLYITLTWMWRESLQSFLETIVCMLHHKQDGCYRGREKWLNGECTLVLLDEYFWKRSWVN